MNEIECWFAFLPNRTVRLQAFNQHDFNRTVAHIDRLADRLRNTLVLSGFEVVEEPWLQLEESEEDGRRYCMVTTDVRYAETVSESDVEMILGLKECTKCISVPSE